MDKLLCDELVQEVFQRLPPSSSSVSLVSKRWLHLHRTSRTSLTLRLTGDDPTVASISTLLSHYPFLSCLSILSSNPRSKTSLADQFLLLVCTFCAKLHSLRFLAGPVSASSLTSLSAACTQLTSLCINLSRPFFLMWIINFPKLRDLSIRVCSGEIGVEQQDDCGFLADEDSGAELGLESLCLSGIGAGDWGLGWLWRSCRKLKKLQLKSCEGVGDGGSFSSFTTCLQGVQEVELRTSRSILDGVLLKLAENCDSLTSLLVYDGGSREALLRFFSQCHCNLQKLDFRLPLDLKNDHLLAVSTNFRSLSILRLQSCCLVSGEGLKALGTAVNCGLEELALINCDVVEREPGLLSALGQNLRKLRKLDLSHNEMLLDKEFMSMLVSCNYLVDLRVRGCKGLTNASIFSMIKSCKCLERVDIMHCSGIQAEAIESFVVNSPQLKWVQVEQSKISDAAKTWASHKFIEAVA
ncbi:F-box/LRR-repeat protein 4 [Argentina anserina]|uniref:F-box/LRR-repeat protein 4 n=1 Tax=Argentina anserina TaxID=57926 RepID=UPI00217661F8|nr:F-box/LRR-repeat protein 4 [Potentilla anserina]